MLNLLNTHWLCLNIATYKILVQYLLVTKYIYITYSDSYTYLHTKKTCTVFALRLRLFACALLCILLLECTARRRLNAIALAFCHNRRKLFVYSVLHTYNTTLATTTQKIARNYYKTDWQKRREV